MQPKGRLSTIAGKELLSMLVEENGAHELSFGAVERLRYWARANEAMGARVPAIGWLVELVDHVVDVGRIEFDVRVDMLLGIENLMPATERHAGANHGTRASSPAGASESDGGEPEPDPATEGQRRYIEALGSTAPPEVSKLDAAAQIDRLLNTAGAVTNRQMMVLRFWDRTDIAERGRAAMLDWLDAFYAENPKRPVAWQAWRASQQTGGRSDDPRGVELGIGANYLSKVKSSPIGCSLILLAPLIAGLVGVF